MNESQVSVPLSARLRLGHAAIQHLADAIGVDVLHIKGFAVDPELRPLASRGSDVDLLVRPEHVDRFDRALPDHGWQLYSTFELGSPFGHAQTYLHDAWGFVDVHRFFPGIRVPPSSAFERMWADRTTTSIAGVGCPVPSVPAQALLLILNAARSSSADRGDIETVWREASDDRRRQIEELVVALDAPVAFAAAVGDLGRFRGERDYRLWKVVADGGSRAEEWWARVRAAPTFADAVRLVARAPLVNVEHLTHRLGRQPTRLEIVAEFFGRPARAVGEAWRGLVGPGARR